MFFTLFYMYATLLQWWRLGVLKNKLSGTLNSQNALLVCDECVVYDSKRSRSFENLLFRREDRIGCTVVPKQRINLSQWVTFPKDCRYFPIYFKNVTRRIESPNIYILIQAVLDSYVKHSAELLKIENYGELLAWRAADNFEVILKTDLDKLTKLVHCYSQSVVDINHELKLLKIETVDIEGNVTKIKYDRKYSKEATLKYSYTGVYWKKFADNVKEIYSKIRDTTNPKITIENGAAKPDDIKKVPINEVKPIKKDNRKSEDKNTLEVGSGDFRRHKSGDHKRDKNASKSEGASKIDPKVKDDHKHKKDAKLKAEEGKRDTKEEKEKMKKKEARDDEAKGDNKEDKDGSKPREHHQPAKKDHHHKKETRSEAKPKEHHHPKREKEKKSDVEEPEQSADKPKSEAMAKRSSSSDKKLVKSAAICEENGDDAKAKETPKEELKDKKGAGPFGQAGRGVVHRTRVVKPPNILVYADSPVAKDNVKAALSSMLNKEKYTIYDLPTDPNQMMWNGSTVLVVVCGTVPPNLTFHLLQYLLNGGQLLCLCSDLLYSVLHTFTTAEVREHELVRFSYGKWKQVKMMHHIFCYQASPAKKQFSKDSDHSNPSSGNGSSPIAPRTPSAVEIQHNGRDYTIQVQVLGTEETWQTPSLLLATVKDGEGKAVFSQVHLEVNPNEYEDDESKFAALKDSDQARLEILKDILLSHLDIDCCSAADVTYTPAYFLGRHEAKLKLLSDCVKDNLLVYDKLTVKFCGKDEPAEVATGTLLPVFIHSCPSNFSTVNYFEALETEHIGRLVIYSDVIASSQFIHSKKLAHGLAVITRQQTGGVGRSNNNWISPAGSANFSLQLHVPLESPLGKLLPLTQLLAMVSVVSAIKNANGCQALQVGIKWPNDLYANGSIKVGGLMANTFVRDDDAIVTIGCGVNLDNKNPTACINDLIKASNLSKGTTTKPIPYEAYFASIFNEFEKIYKIVQAGDVDYIYELYYKHWLHNNCEITVTTKDGKSKKVKIAGVDDCGFLKVRAENGSISTVQPDGNTFDMLKGLIYPKPF